MALRRTLFRPLLASICLLLALSLTTPVAMATPAPMTPPPLSPLEQFRHLHTQLRALESRNPVEHKFLSIGTAVVLDLALELVHARILQQRSPEYFYQSPTIDHQALPLPTLSLLWYTIANGHTPALLFGAGTWIGENLGDYPNLATEITVLELGVLAGIMAAGYTGLYLMTDPSHIAPPALAAGTELINLIPSHSRAAFLGAMQLDHYKHYLQAAGLTVLIAESFIARSFKQASIDEVRQGLVLAREKLLQLSGEQQRMAQQN